YSRQSKEKVERYAGARGHPLYVHELKEDEGAGINDLADLVRRPTCSVCGTLKRYHFNRAAVMKGYNVLATGHNLDDEAARLLGNVLHWQLPYLAKQQPVLAPTHAKFARKVRPLYRTSEYETAVYAFLRGLDYVVEECPNSHGATQLIYKELLNRLEDTMPGSKLAFVSDFLRHAQPLFAGAPDNPPGECGRCG